MPFCARADKIAILFPTAVKGTLPALPGWLERCSFIWEINLGAETGWLFSGYHPSGGSKQRHHFVLFCLTLCPSAPHSALCHCSATCPMPGNPGLPHPWDSGLPQLCRQSCWDRLFPSPLPTAVSTARGRKHNDENQKCTIFVMAELSSLIDPGRAHPEESIFSPSWSRGCSSPSKGSWRQRGPLQILSLLLWGLVVTELGHQPSSHVSPGYCPTTRVYGIPPCPCWNVLPPTTFSLTTSKNQVFFLMPKRHLLSDTCFLKCLVLMVITSLGVTVKWLQEKSAWFLTE